MKLTFHGGVRGVTGSRHLINCNGKNVLLDCGLFQGHRRDTYELNLNFPFDPREVDAVVVSHAHMDHLGNLPNLVKKGFNGEIHCTLPTADLAVLMLYDSAKIQENDIAYVNKVRERHHEPPVSPLYTSEDIPPVTALLHGHGFHHAFDILPGVKATFRLAGHILGSAITILDIDDNGRKQSLCYTGDLGRANLPIIRNPEFVAGADVLIIESTYGDRLHGDIRQVEERLAAVIIETVNRGGKLIVPAFDVGRAQELVYTLHQLKLKKKIADIPVFIDSPMALDATDIYRLHVECYDEETRELMRKDEDPFGFRRLHYIREAEDSKKLNLIQEPVMIVSTSGMAETGRILHHLKNNIEDERNTVLIVGWQAENTLGWKIQNKWETVSIFGEKYKLKAQVEVFQEFSAHADRNDLITWVSKGKFKKIFVVHGEEKSSLSLAKDLQDRGYTWVVVPQVGESYSV